MKATYKGAESSVEVFGMVFVRNVATEVTDAHAMAKLKNHPEFSVDGKPALIKAEVSDASDKGKPKK